MKELSQEIKDALKSLVEQFDLEDRAVRERQIRQWRKNKLYWEGFSRIWYSEVAHDWRVWGQDQAEQNDDAAYYDKPINVYRAYLESIIAALSITIPSVVCIPDDPKNPMDLATARGGDNIYKLVSRHNNISWLWLHALYILCTEGLVACYSYPKEDEKYGTYEEPEYAEDTVDKYICPVCQTQLADELFTNLEADEFSPDDDDAVLHDLIINQKQLVCPQCAAALDPNLQKTPVIVTRIVGTTHKPKTRICLEAYGGLFVKVPNYAMKQEDMPYLLFSYETHYSNAVARYKFIKESLPKGSGSMGGLSTPYEAWARLSTQYRGEYPVNTVTVRNCWLRPSSYNVLGDDDKAEELKKLFPDGVKVVLVNDVFCEASNEALDDCWTLTRNPLADYLHHDPYGNLIANVQDITSDLVALTLQTIEQGIPSTWVDPTVVDMDAYRNAEATPGALYPVKVGGSGKNLSESFFTTKTASLSTEVLPFFDKIQQEGQFVSGALPSLWGGQNVGGGDTASEYAMSRAQAQQRLGTPYKMMGFWWKEIWGKVIPTFIDEMVEDERLVERDKIGNFSDVLIRKAELSGKIGNIELETSETFPVTKEQKKDIIMKLIELNNPLVLEALSAPENFPFVKDVLGLQELELPGNNDVEKEYEEINLLLQSQPLDPMTPSIMVDPELDNHVLAAQVDRTFLTSEQGRTAKSDNPLGYLNVLLHFKQHKMFEMQMMMAAQANASNPEKPNGKVPEAPIKDENDSQAPIH